MNGSPDSPRKILVVKLCCLGDAIFLTPALRALTESFPSAEITYLGSSWIKPILEQIPFIDKILLFDAAHSSVSKPRKARQTFGLINRLRREKFDAVLICHRSPVFALLCFLSGIRTRIGFHSKLNGLFLNRTVVFDEHGHETLRYAELAKALGASFSNTATQLTPLPEEQENAATVLQAHGIKSGQKLIAIFPGGGENPGTSMTIKRWGAENWGQLCRRILEETEARIIMPGGPGDSKMNDEVAALVPEAGDRLINLAGQTKLRTLPALLAACQIAAGGDTGPMHMAAAVGTRTLLLFGPSDPRLVAPLQPNAKYLWKQVECSPCYTPGSVMQKDSFEGMVFGCRTGTHACLKTLMVDEVFEALRPWLAELQTPSI